MNKFILLDKTIYLKCKYDKILDLKNHETIDSLFTYDVINWINQKDRVKPLKELAKIGDKVNTNSSKFFNL